MYETTVLPLPKNVEKIVHLLLYLYPQEYRKKYGKEMYYVLEDMYQEEVRKNGNAGLGFWMIQIGDITKSLIEQHVETIQKDGMKKYLEKTLHINNYNIISGILLLPIFVMFGIDLVSRIVQGDLIHYNRPVYAFVSHTLFYSFPILFTWVRLFPFLAILINLIPLIKNVQKNKGLFFNKTFLKRNIISIMLLTAGLFFLAVIKLHDFVPCMVHGVTKVGIGQISHILSVCRKA